MAKRLAAVGISFALVATLDYVAGPKISTSLFYVSSIVFAALGFGRLAGIAISVAAASVWVAIDVHSALVEQSRWIHFWNGTVRLGFFLLVTLLLAELNRRIQAETRDALTCPLTGLANGRGFRERLEAERRRALRSGRPLSLLYLDLDNFKAVNDSHGHSEGDRVLKAVGAALMAESRATDLAARLGGDEFALLLPETAEEGAGIAADKLSAAVARRMATGGWPVTLSVGAVTFAGTPADTAVMLRHADDAMYAAKHSGKDAIVRRSVGPEDPLPAPAD